MDKDIVSLDSGHPPPPVTLLGSEATLVEIY
jgi:hypothetical protein